MRLFDLRDILRGLDISIHAPMWGATGIEIRRDMLMIISIHAPMWGATVVMRFDVVVADISIHAPMWGATF